MMGDRAASVTSRGGRKILLVEDDEQLVSALTRFLESQCYVVEAYSTIANAMAAFEAFEALDCDAALLDWMLPDGDGTDLCREMRKRGFSRPILFLTARDDILDKLRAFDDGCDDYMVKPIDGRELVARIDAQIKSLFRARVFSGDLEVSLSDMEVRVCGRRLEKTLTPVEMRLLVHFLRNPGRVFTRGQLLRSVFETDADRPTNVVAVHIGNLRRKLGAAGRRLETVSGGYRLRIV